MVPYNIGSVRVSHRPANHYIGCEMGYEHIIISFFAINHVASTAPHPHKFGYTTATLQLRYSYATAMLQLRYSYANNILLRFKPPFYIRLHFSGSLQITQHKKSFKV